MTRLNEIKQIEKTIKADTQAQLKDLLIFMIRKGHAKAIRSNKRYVYYVTKNGDVYSRNKNNKNIKKLKQYIKGKYLAVRINNNKDEYVHRLVAEAFLKDYKAHLQVNHIKNRLNNHVDNLEMCTLLENIAHHHMSNKLENWHVSIKDMRVAETIATDEKNLKQVLDFHYMMSHFISDTINITEVHDISEKETHQSC
ncbi:HNH endonuclease [Macrococcoides canis]|uniref:HNH endonuclease n=1 Tax=Macrococcoides canis TaxID=1855823 RepID=UPI00105D785C|nr:HNH endonuclease [Macrococcus canis]TDM20984.1 hypothetical protein ETI02_11455 [Macrococcus canis]